MLKLIFNHRNGVLGLVIVGIISFAMLGFGVDFFRGDNRQDYAIKVNDQQISNYEYNSRKENYVENLRSRLGQMYEQVRNLINVDKQVRDQLVDQALITQFATKIGFSAGNKEVASRILELFPTETMLSYKKYLSRTGKEPKEFENTIRSALISENYQNVISDLLFVPEREVKAKIIKDRETFDINYVAIDVNSFKEEKEPTDEELLDFYNGVATDFEEKEKVAYEFVAFNPKDFESQIIPDENEVELYYTENISAFTIPEKALVQIIKMPKSLGEKKSKEIFDRVKKGEDFTKLMKEFSVKDEPKDDKRPPMPPEEKQKEEDFTKPKWVQRGDLDISVEEILFGDKQEVLPKIFDIVTTKDYYYIPKVFEHNIETVKPLSEVKDQIKQDIIQGLAPAFAKDKADSLMVLLEQGKEITEPISWSQVALSEKGSFPVNFVGLTDKVLEDPHQKISVFEINNAQILVRVTDYQESKILDFDKLGDKKTKLIELYKEKNMKEASENFANKILTDLNDISLVEEAKNEKLAIETFKGFSKTKQGEGLMGTPALRDAMMKLNKKDDYSKEFVSYDNKLYVFQAVDVVAGSADVKESEILEKLDSTRENQREIAIKNILNVLKNNAEIKYGGSANF